MSTYFGYQLTDKSILNFSDISWDFGVARIGIHIEKSEIEYKCNCSKEKYFNGLIILGKQEIENILKSDNKIEVECHFCGEKYKFTKQDFEGAF